MISNSIDLEIGLFEVLLIFFTFLVGWVGGRNYVLGGLFVSFGGTSLIMAIAFLVIYVTNKQEEQRISTSG